MIYLLKIWGAWGRPGYAMPRTKTF